MSAFLDGEVNDSAEEEEDSYDDQHEHQYHKEIPKTRRVMVKPSPWFNVHHNSCPVTITLIVERRLILFG